MKLADWLPSARARLARAGIESASLEARVLAAHAFGVEQAAIVAHPEWEAPPLLERHLERRLSREPLAYILGWREFYGRRFVVSPDVLIPRQESETLIDAALGLLPSDGPASVWDLGTGSGCLGVTIKLEHPQCRVLASDISEPALGIARVNAANLEAQIDLRLGDLAEVLQEQEHYDLVISNPPYIDEHAILMPEVAHYEPPAALYAAEGGLAFYRRLADSLRARTSLLAVEVGDGMAGSVVQIFQCEGWLVRASITDLLGIERALVLAPNV